MCVKQLEVDRAEVENQYTRSVRPEGNRAAIAQIRTVFIYVGKLDALMAAVAERLTEGGHLAVSIETAENGDWVLRPSGRFAQSPTYMERLATGNSLSVASVTDVTIRTEDDTPIPGQVWVFRK